MTDRAFVPRESVAEALGATNIAAALAASGIDVSRIGSRGLLWAEPMVELEYADRRLEVRVQQPAPINLYTARREVLVAVLTGLVSRPAQRPRTAANKDPDLEIVSPREARVIADAIIAEPPGSFLELRGLLLSLYKEYDTDIAVSGCDSPSDACRTWSTCACRRATRERRCWTSP